MPVTVGLLALGGCCYAVREPADQAVCKVAAHPIDLEPLPLADQCAPASTTEQPATITPVDYLQPADSAEGQPPRLPPTKRKFTERLQYPPGLPGANAPPIRLPEPDTRDPEKTKARQAAIDQLYPPLPPLGPNVEPMPGPDGHPLSLADLQRLAAANSPLLRQAAADVEAAKGAVIQAGAYPNPTMGYEGDQVGGAGGTAGQQGIFIDQLIKTGGKLKLAQAAAIMDLHNAEIAFRRAQADLTTQVRSGYFAVLVAAETVRITEALSTFTDEVYRIQVTQVKTTGAAPYQPMQLRVLAVQARAALVQARNGYVAAWKQLAASLGLPAMPPTQLCGRVDMPIPLFRYDAALQWVLSKHTDVLTTENTVQRARYNLRLAQVTPVPDVDVRFTVQKDYTAEPNLMQSNITIGMPIPIWDHNKGNIIQAQGQLLRAVEEGHRVRDDLTSRLAEAFGRYDTNRQLLQLYRDYILPDQLRGYRGVYTQHNIDPDHVSFGDVVQAQQTLVTTMTSYITVLGTQWTAVVDVANLLQTNDLFQLGPEPQPTECVAPLPDLAHLPPLPCCHPCSPLPDPGLKGADGTWPPAVPAQAPAIKEEKLEEAPIPRKSD
jgi:cobalt-zinc-cadmium efflux system outer membrane protein